VGLVINFNDEKKEDGQQALSTLLDLVSNDLEKVNRTILLKMQSSVPLIPQLAANND
jgi:hypothetical protein